VLHDLKIGSKYEGFLFLAETNPNAPWLQSHQHAELELNLVVRGSVTYVMGEQRYALPAGTLLWLFPEQEHQLVDRSSNAQNYVAVFKPTFIRRVCKTEAYAGLRNGRSEKQSLLHTMLDTKSFQLVRNAMDSLMEGSLDREVLNREAGFGAESDFRYQHADPDGLNAGLHYLLTLCWRLTQERKPGDVAVSLHPAVQHAIRLLSDGDWNESLSALAQKCDVSDAHLSRMFHQQVGVTLNQYRNSLRLARFWEDMHRAPDTNVTDAVYQAGFGSYAQFYKVFFAAHGQGPRSALVSRNMR
jgi:AraC-like DNA-binding protein